MQHSINKNRKKAASAAVVTAAMGLTGLAGVAAPAAQASSDLTYNAPGEVDLLTSQKVTGNLTVGTQRSGRTIYLERYEGNHWERIFTGTTGSNGAYQFPIPAGFYYKGVLRTRVPSLNSNNPAAFSGQQSMVVSPVFVTETALRGQPTRKKVHQSRWTHTSPSTIM